LLLGDAAGKSGGKSSGGGGGGGGGAGPVVMTPAAVLRQQAEKATAAEVKKAEHALRMQGKAEALEREIAVRSTHLAGMRQGSSSSSSTSSLSTSSSSSSSSNSSHVIRSNSHEGGSAAEGGGGNSKHSVSDGSDGVEGRSQVGSGGEQVSTNGVIQSWDHGKSISPPMSPLPTSPLPRPPSRGALLATPPCTPPPTPTLVFPTGSPAAEMMMVATVVGARSSEQLHADPFVPELNVPFVPDPDSAVVTHVGKGSLAESVTSLGDSVDCQIHCAAPSSPVSPVSDRE
jgi:hypothetical protein